MATNNFKVYTLYMGKRYTNIYDVTYSRDTPESFLADWARVDVLQINTMTIRLVHSCCTFDHSKIQV